MVCCQKPASQCWSVSVRVFVSACGNCIICTNKEDSSLPGQVRNTANTLASALTMAMVGTLYLALILPSNPAPHCCDWHSLRGTDGSNNTRPQHPSAAADASTITQHCHAYAHCTPVVPPRRAGTTLGAEQHIATAPHKHKTCSSPQHIPCAYIPYMLSTGPVRS